MIRQQVGDLLEIEFEQKFYYVVVLTKIAMFGGNIVFAYHGDGSRRTVAELVPCREGFNICTDLLLPKKQGVVTRIYRFEDLAEFWLTKFTKRTFEYRRGVKAKSWIISEISDFDREIGQFRELSREYREAMDEAMFSFDLAAKKMLAGYTPDQNEHL